MWLYKDGFILLSILVSYWSIDTGNHFRHYSVCSLLFECGCTCETLQSILLKISTFSSVKAKHLRTCTQPGWMRVWQQKLERSNRYFVGSVSRWWQHVEDDPREVPGYKRCQYELCLSSQPQRSLTCCSSGWRHHWPHPGPKVFPLRLPETPPPTHQQRRPGNQSVF